jgi:hypothetical protein
MDGGWRWWVFGIGAALYAASFALPTYEVSICSATRVVCGVHVFLGAPLALADSQPAEVRFWQIALGLLANPAIWMSLLAVALGRWPAAALCAACGLALASPILLTYFDGLLRYPGYWVWAGSAGFLLVACLFVIACDSWKTIGDVHDNP